MKRLFIIASVLGVICASPVTQAQEGDPIKRLQAQGYKLVSIRLDKPGVFVFVLQKDKEIMSCYSKPMQKGQAEKVNPGTVVTSSLPIESCIESRN